MVGKQCEILVGSYPNPKKVGVTILEEIGNGFLAQSLTQLQYCWVHYDIRGRLCSPEFFDREEDARKEAEENKFMMS